MNNREINFVDIKNKLFNGDNKYDVVISAVTNDDLVGTFDLFRGGFMSMDNVVKQLTFKNLTNQYSFHSEKAVAYLKVGSK